MERRFQAIIRMTAECPMGRQVSMVADIAAPTPALRSKDKIMKYLSKVAMSMSILTVHDEIMCVCMQYIFNRDASPEFSQWAFF